jgi:hypothetical protein
MCCRCSSEILPQDVFIVTHFVPQCIPDDTNWLNDFPFGHPIEQKISLSSTVILVPSLGAKYLPHVLSKD